MSERLDYTKMKAGTVVRQWTYKGADGIQRVGRTHVRRCPKCRRNGEQTINKDKAGVVTSHHYTHAGNVVTIGGFSMLQVDDNCTVLTPDGERMKAEREAAKGVKS